MQNALPRRSQALPWVVSLLMLVIASTRVLSQGGDASRGTLQGSATGAPMNIPLPFAVVSLPQLGIERFSDAEGRFTLGALQVGRYEIVIRRIGYVPFRDSVLIAAGVVTRLDARLSQIPAQLARTTVVALTSCPRPGAPDRERDPIVADLVSLLRENADRYRLLVQQYPFSYLQIRAMGQLGDASLTLQSVDTTLGKGLARVTYRPGRVVSLVSDSRRGKEYSMSLPTILDLADDQFVRNHCFAYGGASDRDGETWLRLDVRAADKIRSPDVHGSFYLDSATSELRRMDLTMSRPDRLPKALQGVRGVDVVTSFVNIASGLSVIDKVCGLNFPRRVGISAVRTIPAELQQLLAYQFVEAPSGVRASVSVLPPETWRAGAVLPRSVVWCAP
jgi:Carboxypeptidase regulatory-like domain